MSAVIDMDRRMLNTIVDGQKEMSGLLIDELRTANRSLSTLNERLSNLLMIFGILGAANLVIGNGLADSINFNKPPSSAVSWSCPPKTTQTVEWTCAYYERMD